MEFPDLSQELVLFYLWRAAQPDTAVVNRDPKPIRCAADVKWYLDLQKGEKHFVWLDGRPLFLTLRGHRVTTHEYETYNGKGTASKALALLERAVKWYTEELGSREKALEYLIREEPRHLAMPVDREYGPGRALFDALTLDPPTGE